MTVYIEMDWAIFTGDTQEVIGCFEREDGGMTPVMTVGSWEERLETGRFHAKLNLGGIVTRSSGDTLPELRDEVVKELKRFHEGELSCLHCDGSGLFATASWDSPEIPCDYCERGEMKLDEVTQ